MAGRDTNMNSSLPNISVFRPPHRPDCQHPVDLDRLLLKCPALPGIVFLKSRTEMEKKTGSLTHADTLVATVPGRLNQVDFSLLKHRFYESNHSIQQIFILWLLFCRGECSVLGHREEERPGLPPGPIGQRSSWQKYEEKQAGTGHRRRPLGMRKEPRSEAVVSFCPFLLTSVTPGNPSLPRGPL